MLFEEDLKSKMLNTLLSWWWVACFILLCLISYIYASKKKSDLHDYLSKRTAILMEIKDKALVEKEDLLLQINSQSDPLWVQMALMKGLGLVPEGQRKIHFKDQ